MKPDLFWIPGPWPGRLAIATRPRGGDWLQDEIGELRSSSVDWMVSLLEPEEAAQLDLSRESDTARGLGMGFLSLPIPDRGVPAAHSAVVSTIRAIAEALDQGQSVAIHCRQGVGRSGMIAAGVLVNYGIAAERAVEIVTDARGLTTPETAAQLEWIREYASTRLVVTR